MQGLQLASMPYQVLAQAAAFSQGVLLCPTGIPAIKSFPTAASIQQYMASTPSPDYRLLLTAKLNVFFAACSANSTLANGASYGPDSLPDPSTLVPIDRACMAKPITCLIQMADLLAGGTTISYATHAGLATCLDRYNSNYDDGVQPVGATDAQMCTQSSTVIGTPACGLVGVSPSKVCPSQQSPSPPPAKSPPPPPSPPPLPPNAKSPPPKPPPAPPPPGRQPVNHVSDGSYQYDWSMYRF